MSTKNEKPQPGDSVILLGLPPKFLDDLPEEDQMAISAKIGKVVRLEEYDELGRAELSFHDSDGNGHSIWVYPQFYRTLSETELPTKN
ncbi:MAG TPA: hypothetical protein VGF20_09860 [Candidatus Acidoferrum sp.]